MSTAIMEAQLRAALDTDLELAKRGCRTRFHHPSGVGVEFKSTEVGVWHWTNGRFELLVDGKGPVVSVDTVAEATRYTRESLSG
jgi:hypothetical protein